MRRFPRQPLSHSAGLQKNADGSVDIYFGPRAQRARSPKIATKTGGHFEIMFRAYGPEKVFFEKTWKLPVIDRGYRTPVTFTRFLCPGSPRT